MSEEKVKPKQKCVYVVVIVVIVVACEVVHFGVVVSRTVASFFGFLFVGCVRGCMYVWMYGLGFRGSETQNARRDREGREKEGGPRVTVCKCAYIVKGEQNEAVFGQKRGRKERKTGRGESHRKGTRRTKESGSCSSYLLVVADQKEVEWKQDSRLVEWREERESESE